MGFRIFVYLLAAFALAASAYSAEMPRSLRVIAITDFHGALLPELVKTADGQTVPLGGAALLASHIKVLKAKASGPSLVIDAGDLFQGTLESNIAEGAPVIRFYNQIGVAAAALGNHEFDFGPVGEKSIPLDPEDDPRGALKLRVRQAKFPFLAANVIDEKGKTPSWLKRSVVYTRDGLRVGIIGAATPLTPSTTVKANLVGLRFEDPAPYVLREARYLREQRKVHVVILTYHGGGGCQSNRLAEQDDLSSCKAGELFELLRKMPEGLIDVAVGGHTHQGIAKRIGRTAVLQAYARGQQVAWAEVPLGTDARLPYVAGFAPVCGAMIEGKYGPHCLKYMIKNYKGPLFKPTFRGVDIYPDLETLQLIEPDLERVREIKNTPLGVKALTPLTRSYSDESALGNLTADIMRGAVEGADIAVTNGGGLRADISAGPVFYGHVFEVLPFDNRLAKIRASGDVVRRMVEEGHAGKGGGLTWSGLRFTADGCSVLDIEVGGKPLEPSAEYRIVTSDYLANGGSGFDRVGIDPANVKVMWEGPYVMRDVVARALKEAGRDLNSFDFYDPKAPRQRLKGRCKKE